MRVLHILNGHRDVVRNVRFSPDGGQLASASDDRSISLWRADDGTLLFMAWSWDGQRLAAAGRSGRIWVIDSRRATARRMDRLYDHQQPHSRDCPCEEPQQVSDLMQLAAGEFAGEYHRRKGRTGAFWGGRYFATMVEDGDYLWLCLFYVELSVVRCSTAKGFGLLGNCGFETIPSFDHDRRTASAG